MKIVAIGNSITERYPFSNQESWVEHLAQGLKCHVLNQGICGDFTSGMCKRFQRDVQGLISFRGSPRCGVFFERLLDGLPDFSISFII